MYVWISILWTGVRVEEEDEQTAREEEQEEGILRWFVQSPLRIILVNGGEWEKSKWEWADKEKVKKRKQDGEAAAAEMWGMQSMLPISECEYCNNRKWTIILWR